MKSAFTMIELIFVIVILGILAAIAVPKLGGVKEKAEVTKAVTQFTTLVNDVMVYYNLHDNDVSATMSDMTNTPDKIKVSGAVCATFTATKKSSDPAELKATLGTDKKCGGFFDNDTIKTMLNSYAAASSTAVASRSTGVVYMDGPGQLQSPKAPSSGQSQQSTTPKWSGKTCKFNLNTGVATCS